MDLLASYDEDDENENEKKQMRFEAVKSDTSYPTLGLSLPPPDFNGNAE
jgi:hypothetical protein